ncbi:uncharacterized protein LOC113351996 [Papaver somniferum]|uniref:uncharacterized protein LOC113351996 n=1 Tax=Papaver somniferum TaxID=3469 RepID=UPI000E6FF6FA|nr:uncharacterized protein LOC113351996 [Papaver somniferum]
MAWVNWTKVSLLKKNSGLGIKNLRLTNKSILPKWSWRYATQRSTPWRNIAQQKGMVNKNIALPADNITVQGNILRRNITRMVPEIQRFVTFKINDGKNIIFWFDHWTDRGSIKDMFPVIFKACKHKQATISEMIRDGSWQGNFKANLNQNEQMEWDILLRDLGHVPTLVDEDDDVHFVENVCPKSCYNATIIIFCG